MVGSGPCSSAAVARSRLFPSSSSANQPQTSAWESGREGKEAGMGRKGSGRSLAHFLLCACFPTNSRNVQESHCSSQSREGGRLPCLPSHEPRLPGQLTARKAFPSGPCRHGVPPCACLVGKVDHWNDDVGPIDTTYYHHRDT